MACLNGFRITIFALLGAAAYFAFLDNGNDFIARIRRAPGKHYFINIYNINTRLSHSQSRLQLLLKEWRLGNDL